MAEYFPKSSVFEKVVLSRAYGGDPYFQKASQLGPNIPSNDEREKRTTTLDQQDDGGSCKWCWWRPGNGSLIFQYFENSSMHGLKYIAQPQRHLSERIFWCISFTFSALIAVYLINVLWVRYNENPVVVSFGAFDVHLDEVPFPAVTICNMNKISKDVINKLLVRAEKNGTSNLATTARWRLRYVKSMCDATLAFSKRNGFSSARGHIDISKYSYNSTKIDNEIISFLAQWTTPCDEMIRACVWRGKKRNCSELFKTSFTALGKCCSFNRVPTKILLTEELRKWFEVNVDSKLSAKEKYHDREIKSWYGWDHTNGFIRSEGEIRPRFQSRPGAPYGLSFLLDPHVNRYFCSSSDSQGFRLRLHNPVDAPQMTKYSMAIGLNQEIALEVTPTVTMADPDLHSFPFERRECLFTHERELKFYSIYTQKNCFLECISETMRKNCSCVPYTLLKAPKTPICSSDPKSRNNQCSTKIAKEIDSNIRHFCPTCAKTCAELSYNFKRMVADLQNSSNLWLDHSDKLRRPPDWAENKMSIVHIYMSRDAYFPRVRSEMYGTVDLIANTGNLLTLWLGFSILSAFEIIYFFTVRVFWNNMQKFYASNFRKSGKIQPETNPKVVESDVITDPLDSGSFRSKLQNLSMYDAPSSFYMMNELYHPAQFLGRSHIKQQ